MENNAEKEAICVSVEQTSSKSEKEILDADMALQLNGKDFSTGFSSQVIAEKRGTWRYQFDFLLSCVGYAIGLGNIWRFPFLCMRNGGGAFLIPYFMFLFMCGIPLFFLELSIGQFSSQGIMTIWKVAPMFKGLGYGMVLVSGLVCIYYNVILAWSLYYLLHSFTLNELPWASCCNPWNTPHCLRRGRGGMLPAINTNSSNVTEECGAGNETLALRVVHNQTTTPAEEFWTNNVLQLSSGISELGYIRWELLGCLAAAWAIVFLCLFRGIRTSGKVVYVTATLPYLMMFVMLIRGLTLPGAMEGIKFYLTPDFSRLTHFSVWCEACAQIFYSLGPAYGSLITMASYNKFTNNCYRDSIVIPLVNCLTSFFCGFVVFSIIGFMASEAGLPVDKVITSGPGLAFIVYPEAISQLPLSQLWAVMFFLMLIIVGLDTQFGMFEALVSGFCDELPRLLKGKKRKTLFTGCLAVFQFLIGIPIVTQGGMYIFQIFDWYSATFALITISFLECVVLGWVYGGERVLSDMELMFGTRPSVWWRFCWQVITPALLLMVLVFTVWSFSPPSYGTYTYPVWAEVFGWSLACCSLIPIPVLAVYRILTSQGSLIERVRKLSRPTNDWGPALKENRQGGVYSNVQFS